MEREEEAQVFSAIWHKSDYVMELRLEPGEVAGAFAVTELMIGPQVTGQDLENMLRSLVNEQASLQEGISMIGIEE